MFVFRFFKKIVIRFIQQREFKKRLKELKKRDPFIYK